MQCHCAVPRIHGRSSQRAPWAGLSPVLSCSGLRVHPGFSIPTQLCAFSPRSTAGTLEPLPSHCPVWVFISRVCIGASLQCSWWLLKFLLLPMGFPGPPPAAQWGFHSRTWWSCGPVSCGLETIRKSAHPPLTCARNSGGTPAAHTCSGCGRASAQVGCGNKSNPV